MATYCSEMRYDSLAKTLLPTQFPSILWLVPLFDSMKCPIDGAELERNTYEANIEVDRCQTCRGMWLDENELQRIQDSGERDYSDEIKLFPDLVGNAHAMALEKSKAPRKCLQCDREMERREYVCSQVLIDTCPECRGV